MEQDGASNRQDAKPQSPTASSAVKKSPKKRRKVNHACVYCRRSHMTCDLERPCTRCIKRNIEHLCHDEPQPESATKKSKNKHSDSVAEEEGKSSDQSQGKFENGINTSLEQSQKPVQESLGTTSHPQGGPLELVQPSPVSGIQANALIIGYPNDWLGSQNQFQDMHNYHPSYMFNAPEVNNEYNLLNDFLNNSLLDEGAVLPDDTSGFYADQASAMLPGRLNPSLPPGASGGPLAPPGNPQGSVISRPASVIPTDKAREYYLQAADPTGNDAPEERMQRLLRAKYDAGMLKPFNYVKGYARLSSYMDSHMHAASKQKILRQLEKFRPKFREKVQALTDIELIYVEMWFERSLMEYDRIFASMAIPACCWRRTGEIFRGNKEMAELIHVPIEKLRDGKIAIHEILYEESLVNYWEKFGAIAFDLDQKALLTTFSTDLLEELPRAEASKASGTLFSEIERHISAFPYVGEAAASKCKEIDKHGTTLWNLCTRLRRDCTPDTTPTMRLTILLMARVFAFLLLDCAHQGGKSATGNLTRLMKIGIKAAKNCLENKQIPLALRVLEKLASYQVILQKPNDDYEPEQKQENGRLISEYYILRTATAWRQDNLLVAEHMFDKSVSSKELFDPNTSESLADVLYEIGKDLLVKKQYEIAVKWLERAYELLINQELDRLSMNASELRMSIMEALVKSLLGLHRQEATERADGLVALLENDSGDKLVVSLLRLEILSATTNEFFDSNSYSDVLSKMVRSLILSESNLKLVIHHIRKLNDKSPSLACGVLDELLSLRVLHADKDEWIEKVLITRLWMTVGQRDGSDSIAAVEQVLSTIMANVQRPVSPAATLAAHTLLWKRVESNYTQAQFQTAEGKLLLCALGRKDIGSAQEIFISMSDAAKNEPMTRFLMYKIAIRCGERELAAESLEKVSSSSTKDSTLLYACVLDAQQLGSQEQALAALLVVLEKYGYGAPGTVHLPSLLRITIKLMESVLQASKAVEGSPNAKVNVEQLCKLFEGATGSLKRSPPSAGNGLWNAAELDWFSKNSYNIAIKYLAAWHPRHSLRMLVCCITFIDHYPRDISDEISDDLSLRKMFCDFSAATALVSIARGEDDIEQQLQDYLNLRKHVGSFDSSLQEKLPNMEKELAQDLLQKFAIILAFDFEAACRLKAWDDLGKIILTAVSCKILIATVKKIVNGAWNLEDFDSVKLAKYMRCIFQIAITDNPDISESMLDQIYSLAQEISETETPYPAEELEWVCTRAFNHAVDLYCAGDDNASRAWAEKALNIAHLCRDNGSLERLLQSKFVGLKWDA
ncbi:hypothetical protein B7494_g7694 [Chlorociboria aeruginascens]|nr:hypothetical protein B7494_g7694 [Chlorociboria aeruginascens]